MDTIEEALAEATPIVVDSAADYIIDQDFRTIAIPNRGTVFGVEGDKKVNRIVFRIPRYYKGVDLAGFKPRVAYVNANKKSNLVEVDDMQEYTAVADTLRFSWLLDEDVTYYRGTITFAVGLREFDETDKTLVTRAFNTTIATATSLQGLPAPTTTKAKDWAKLYSEIDEYITTKSTGIAGAIADADRATSDAERQTQLATAAQYNAETAKADAIAASLLANTANSAATSQIERLNKAITDANAALANADSTLAKAKDYAPIGLYVDADGDICQR